MASKTTKFKRETPSILGCTVSIKMPDGTVRRRKFKSDVQTSIFCTSIYNGFYSSHTDRELEKFICSVEDVFFEDENPSTSIFELSDFMAANWDKIKSHVRKGDYDRHIILCHYYEELG